MSGERLAERLQEIPVPSAVQARERAVASARAEVAGRHAGGRSWGRGRRRTLTVVCATALLGGALLTPPGRAASGWVGQLVGIGEVGGSPTQKKRGFDATSAPIVVDNGRAPDGSRYEWVAYGCKVDLHGEGVPTRFRGFGLSLEWPGVKGHEGSGSCEGPREKGEKIPLIGSFGVSILPSQFKGVPRPDVVVEGTTHSEDARRVRVVYRDADGRKRDLPVDFARVDGELRERAGTSVPLGTFVAFVDGDQAYRDRLEDCLDLRAMQTVPGHNPAKRCAERNPEVRAHQERLAKCTRERGAPAPSDREGQARLARCLGPPPPSPVQVIVYDANDRELGRRSYPTAAHVLPAPRFDPSLPRRKPRARHRTPGSVGEPVVLASGRAPDGARYEYVHEKFAERGRVFSYCVTLWWPAVPDAGGHGFCGPGLPGATAYGKRHPERVAAKPFGFLDVQTPATAYLVLRGFARPQVSRVRVVYKARRGAKHDAPVKLVHVRGALARRLSADEPFGFFVSFLPRSVKKYYSGPAGRAVGPPAIEVIAYDDHGRKIGRVKHRN